MSRRHVVVCGLPSSGNHYLQRLLTQAGWAVRIIHGIEPHAAMRWTKESERGATCAVMPVRDQLCSKASCEYGRIKYWPQKNLNQLDASREARVMATKVTMANATRLDFDMLMVSYEALCANPVHVLGDVLKWLGETEEAAIAKAVEATSKEPPEDGNAKYYREWEEAADAAV